MTTKSSVALPVRPPEPHAFRLRSFYLSEWFDE